jgi:hypothetical protein
MRHPASRPLEPLVGKWNMQADGVAIIGFDAGKHTYLQHYFDSRGVARVYEMSVTAGVWTLTRIAPDLSPLDFSQRFTGTFSVDYNTIDGRWETSDDGSRWEHDFDLTYIRLIDPALSSAVLPETAPGTH